ncbi:MAG: cytochrome P450, partial [Acidimicrobiia bacterium]|nr:cytochrome P450 [Acidimicrobiia bacterium]
DLYHDLERGTDALAFVDPYADIESFAIRDSSRAALVELVQGIMTNREVAIPAEGDDRDLLDVLMSIREEDGSLRFTADQVTGIFISMMFAGHHTTSTTASWMLIELLRRPEQLGRVLDETDRLNAGGEEISYRVLREMPWLEAALKETLRLHPPLILLLRVAKVDLEIQGLAVKAGQMVGASPWVSNRIPEAFVDPDEFECERYIDPRAEDELNPWNWIPFGAGRHRCVGAAFAMMQLKAIFTVLFRDWSLELAQPSDSYRADMSKMVIQLEQPARVRYSRRVKGM